MMDKIPILISTPGHHTHPEPDASDYSFPHTTDHGSTSQLTTNHSVVPLTQKGADTINLPPPPFCSTIHAPKPIHQSWIEQILPHKTNGGSHTQPYEHVTQSDPSHLAVPEIESPRRPATPRADLYEGQSESCFGMTFDHDKGLHTRKSKPIPNAFSHEDQKHRMTMDWLERRGSW